MGRDAADAWTKAYEADKVSIFGGIVALNRPVTREAAELMKPIFLEIIMAPSFTPEALEVLSTKKNLRLLEVPMEKSDAKQRQLVSVTGGLLVQDLDLETRPVTADMCVTEKRPTEDVYKRQVSPDTCRLWDMATNEKLDKDRFRRDLGKVREAYEEILARLEKVIK